jgi:hypothetical protein
MSMQNILNKLNKGDFDPNKGKIENDRMVIPDGTYNVTLSAVTHGVWNNSNTDYIRFDMTVLDGKEAGRIEFIRPTLAQKTAKGKEMPDFVLSRSIQTIKIIGAMVGYNVPNKPFIDAISNESTAYEELTKDFQPYIGKTMKMTIKSSPNKKNPEHPYRNYEFAKSNDVKIPTPSDKDDPFAGQKTKDPSEISDDDLPF